MMCLLQNSSNALHKRCTKPYGSLLSQSLSNFLMEILHCKPSQVLVFISKIALETGSSYYIVCLISGQTTRLLIILNKISILHKLNVSVKIISTTYSPRVCFATICFMPNSFTVVVYIYISKQNYPNTFGMKTLYVSL